MTEKARVSVYDLAGNKVAEMSNATAGQAVGGLAKGMYIIKTVSANGIKTGKVQIKWLSGNLVGISINLCKSIQKELFINDAP